MARKIIIISIVIFAFSGLGGWFYYSYFWPVNYLIPGVPYNGIYNIFYEKEIKATPLFASVMSILGYWGDSRFSNADLMEYLDLPGKIEPDIPVFFKDVAGYEVYQLSSSKSGSGFRQAIKKFVNPQNKIPVIIFQKQSITGESPEYKPKVMIGIFDKEKKVIVHDYYLGNNYEISYQDFEKMFTKDIRLILAVWPSDTIKGLVKGPDYSKPYPARLKAMDKLGPVLATKLADAYFYYRKLNDLEKSTAAYKSLVEDPNFQYFPKAFQVSILSAFANNYFKLNQFDEAINIIEEYVLPLNKNLSEAPDGWFVLPLDKFVYPYYVLSWAYLKKGEKAIALSYYNEMMTVRRLAIEKIGEDDISFKQRIEKLEKEISAEK